MSIKNELRKMRSRKIINERLNFDINKLIIKEISAIYATLLKTVINSIL